MANKKIGDFTALVGNTLWTLNGAFQFDFGVQPNTVEEVLQNLYNIWAVPIYSQPYQYDFGNDTSWIDAPGNIAALQMQVAFLLGCAKWEPRAQFNTIKVSFTTAQYVQGQYNLYTELNVDLSQQITNSLFSSPQPSNTWVVDNLMTGAYPSVNFDLLTL
jgi:phage baseplate assembly protein W